MRVNYVYDVINGIPHREVVDVELDEAVIWDASYGEILIEVAPGKWLTFETSEWGSVWYTPLMQRG